MELVRLIDSLSDPGAYCYPVDFVEVRHTHISVVFLAGHYVFKVKKPVDLGFVDFTTLEKRRYFCQEEVRLNRRLAPAIYLGVVPITRTTQGVEMDGQGDIVEWAVKMVRLPEKFTLEQHLLRNEIGPVLMDVLARKIADFHKHAEFGSRIAAFGRFDVVARNARENFEQSAPLLGVTLSQPVLQRLGTLTEQKLEQIRPLIEARALRGVPREGHGDLHLEHIYYYPKQMPPGDLVIIDCVEFNERFRNADPIADMAFLVMDLCFHGRQDLAKVFAAEYFRASGDIEGPSLLDFYTSYRAAVRAKVEGFESLENEVPELERRVAQVRAKAHWLLALSTLEKPKNKPCAFLIGGLPGTGKSTLANGLRDANFCLIRSDLVRKELAGLSPHTSAPNRFGEGIYTSEWTERTYAKCLQRFERLLFEGNRIIVDASFREEKWRQAFLETAKRLGVPSIFLLCRANPRIVRNRLEHRHDDASDASLAIYQQMAKNWEEIGPLTQPFLRELPFDGKAEESIEWSNRLLGVLGLL